MTARVLKISSLAAVAALGLVANADAATKKAAASALYPTVTKVTPMKVGVGDPLTITGKNFLAGKFRNTVVFKRDGKRAVFAKASTATKTKLIVTVPDKLKPWMAKAADGRVIATRFRLRILSRRFGKTYTKVSKSPLVDPEALNPLAGPNNPTAPGATAPADCDADGQADTVDVDDDNDKLLDTTEAAIGTDACKADTDGDQISDAYEYKSAVDLNQRSCQATAYPTPCAAALPYPSKRPYPNPLDPKDASVDFDGDWLTTLQEYTATVRHGAYDLAQPLWYSAGLKASQDSDPNNGCIGMAVPPPFDGIGSRPEFLYNGTYPDVTQPAYAKYTLDDFGSAKGDGCLNDGERDEDGDFLTNHAESGDSLSNTTWWNAVYEEPLFLIQYEGTDWLNGDSDGDGVVDGLDDQDHDDFLNVEELGRLRGALARTKDDVDTGVRTGLWVDAFNPCLPSTMSRTCPSTIPVEGDEVYRPFMKPTDDKPPLPRWPLYGTAEYGTEVWDGGPTGISQTMPPPHPLPR